jgi:hypothetical protein
MRPRFFPTAQAELGHINVALRRMYPSTRRKTRKQRLPNLGVIALTIRDLGRFALAIGIFLIVLFMLTWRLPEIKVSHPDAIVADPDAVANNSPTGWPKVVDPQPMYRPDAVANNHAPPQLASSPTPRRTKADLRPADQFIAYMPDGREIVVTWVVDYPGQNMYRWEDLPWTGNKIGDARYVWSYCHWFVWTVPLTSANATPTWIDP